MLRGLPLAAMVILLLMSCAAPRPGSVSPGPSPQPRVNDQEATGRCTYALEGAVGLAAAVAVLGIARDRPAEEVAYMIPLSAGVGWLWGRFVMPPRARCRAVRTDSEGADSSDTGRPPGLEESGA